MPLNDDLQRFELECPSCKRELSEWRERCPHCGQDLLEDYSGTYRAHRASVLRGIAIVVLLAVLVGLVRLVFYALRP